MKKHLFLITLHLAACAADGYYTSRNAHAQGFAEHDPLARVFVTHGDALRVSYFASEAALTLTLDEYLRKHGHPRVADALLTAQIIDSSTSAAFSAKHFHEK